MKEESSSPSKLISEYIDIRGNQTVVPVKIQGRGVEPKFKITPEFIVGKMRSNFGHPTKLSFLIENQCDANLEFEMFKLYTKEGPIYHLDPPEMSGTPSNKGGKKRLTKGRKSVARKSVSRKSTSRKSLSRKSLSRKTLSMADGRKKSSTKSTELDLKVQKSDIKDEGRKNLAAPTGKNKLLTVPSGKNYDELLRGDLIHSLKEDFQSVDVKKEDYLFTIPPKRVIKPHTTQRYEFVFRPFKQKNPEEEEKGFSRKSVSGRSLSQKSMRRSSKKQSVHGEKKKSVARKSVARKSVARKSVAKKKKNVSSRKSMSVGGHQSKISRKSSLKRTSGSKKPAIKKIEYIMEEEMFKKTYVSKVRLMLGSHTRVLDWWLLGQVFDEMESIPRKIRKQPKQRNDL